MLEPLLVLKQVASIYENYVNAKNLVLRFKESIALKYSYLAT